MAVYLTHGITFPAEKIVDYKKKLKKEQKKLKEMKEVILPKEQADLALIKTEDEICNLSLEDIKKYAILISEKLKPYFEKEIKCTLSNIENCGKWEEKCIKEFEIRLEYSKKYAEYETKLDNLKKEYEEKLNEFEIAYA